MSLSNIVKIFLGVSQLIFNYVQFNILRNLNSKIEDQAQILVDFSSKVNNVISDLKTDVMSSQVTEEKLTSAKDVFINKTDVSNSFSSWLEGIDVATSNEYLLKIAGVVLILILSYYVVLPYVLPSIAPTLPYFFKKSVEEKSKEIVESAASAVSQVPSPITIPPMGKAGPVLGRPDSIANVGLPENEDGQFLSDYLASIWDLAGK